MTIQPIEVEARAYLKQYTSADGSPGNYRTDLIAGLLEALDTKNAAIARMLVLLKEAAMLDPEP